MKSAYINSLSDIHTWIINHNPGNVIDGDGLTDQLARAIQADDHPAWGADWAPWLDENAERIAASEL